MAMLEVLSEVICAEKLLRLVALCKLVNYADVIPSYVPLRRIRKLFATISAQIGVSAVGVILVESGLNTW